MPSEIIKIVIELMFLGVNMFLALLRTHLSPRRKMSLSRAKNIFTPTNINSIVILHRALRREILISAEIKGNVVKRLDVSVSALILYRLLKAAFPFFFNRAKI